MLTLWQNRVRVEKSVYKNGINVALHHAENSDTYIKFLNRSEKTLFDPIKRVASSDIASLTMVAKAATTEALVTQVGALIATDSFGNKLDLAAFLVWAGERGGQAALDKLEIQGIFELKNKDLVNYFEDHSKLLIRSVDDYTKEWIAEKIQEGKNKGLSPKEISQTLLEDGKVISRVRAERIVLTETASAMTKVENEAARRYGIKEKIWRTSRDERTCPICLELEGKRASIIGNFPGGYDGPPAHPSCRCFEEEVIPDDWETPNAVWTGQ